MEFIGGLVLGGLVGVVMTVILQPTFENYWGKFISFTVRHIPRRPVLQSNDLDVDRFVQLMSWSLARPLDPKHHKAKATDHAEDRERIPLPILGFDNPLHDHAGIAGSVVGYKVDHGEAGQESLGFEIEVDSARYSEGIAFQQALLNDDFWHFIQSAVQAEGPHALSRFPANTFFVNLTLTTRFGNTLALRRASGGVSTARGMWALGSCETMTSPFTLPGSVPEDFFALAHRAAKEEFGIEAREMGPIWVSWFGLGRDHGLFYVAHTTTLLSESDVVERIKNSHASYETDGIRWLRLIDAEFKSLISSPDPNWLPLTRIASRDLLRLRYDLASSPIRRW